MPSRTIVAVSNEYGAGGATIGKAVADALGFEFVDEQLPVVVARRLQISERDAEAAEDTRRSVGERVLASLERATPELAMPSLRAEIDERYLAEVRRAVLEYAARGDVVILGRGGGAILGRRPDVLRVFIHAPRPWRVERIIEVHGVDESTAAAELDRVDAARGAHLRDVFGLSFGDPHSYDISLDAAQLGVNGSVAAIIAAVRAEA
jgi:cytidylate kinase